MAGRAVRGAPEAGSERRARGRALLALALLVPVPTLGALAGMVWLPGTRVGAGLFAFAKVWILALPLAWHVAVDRAPLSLSPARRGGFGMAVGSGIAISLVILAVFAGWGGRLIDAAILRERVAAMGLGDPMRYALAALYWTLVNALLEEYVWRWFVVRKCAILLRSSCAAIAASAAFFTLHHLFALRVYFGTTAVAVAGTGVFLGGVIWSWMYLRYRSIWPGYVSHAIVDLCLFALGAHLLFFAAEHKRPVRSGVGAAISALERPQGSCPEELDKGGG